MKNEQIELLMSSLLDGELRSDQRSEAERLLVSDSNAKSIYEDYKKLHLMFDAVRSPKTAALDLPANFAQTVLANIDSRTATAGSSANYSGYADKIDWKARLSNPRIWAFPILAILVALGITYLPLFNGANQSGNNHGPDVAITTETPENDQPVVPSPGTEGNNANSEWRIAPPPMPGIEQDQAILTPQQIIERQRDSMLKSGLEIPCVVNEGSATLEPRLLPVFAEQGINWTKTTQGANGQTVFEVVLTPKNLNELLEVLKNDAAMEVQVPGSLEKTLPGVAPERTIKVRFFAKP